MPPESELSLDARDADVLQELMNIAFGRAAADLAQVIDVFVVLSVPRVAITTAAEIPGRLGELLANQARVSIVEQDFRGGFRGHAFLILPANSSRTLLSVLGGTRLGPEVPNESYACACDHGAIAQLERETLLEVGNILIGACVGKLSELLASQVSYSPPMMLVHDVEAVGVRLSAFDASSPVILLQTLFSFGDEAVGGHVLLVLGEGSAPWLREALARFLAGYEQA